MNQKKIKVLYVGMTSGVGGVESFMCNINEYFDHSMFDVDFLVHQKPNDKYLNSIKKCKGNVFYVQGIKSGVLKYLKSIFTFYKLHHYDIVHLNECSASYFIYCLPLLFDRKTKLVVHSHNGDSSNSFIHKIFCFLQNKRSDLNFSCSDVASKWMFNKKKSIIIHNGIDLKKYKYNNLFRNEIRNELNINDSTFVIGSVARFEEQKNHKKIISIFKEYLNSNDNSVLVLVGAGSLKEEIKELANRYKIINKILFLGIRNDITKILSAFDVFLMPSLYEGLPFVCIESQANGLPMLVSDTISNEMILTELIHVKKLKDNDISWCAEIEKIRNKKIERDSNIYINRLISSGYDINQVAKVVENEYLKLLREKAGFKNDKL